MNVLAVSYCFPPFSFPRSIQVARLLKHLPHRTVLVCAEDPFASVDRTIEPDAEASLVECVRVRNPIPAWRRMVAMASRRYRVPLLQALDPHGPWMGAALAAVHDYLRGTQQAPDILLTFAQPWIVHRLGLRLKRCLDIPWIAHFSDPWTDNPYAKSTGLAGTLARRAEAETVNNAECLIFTSDETVELVMKKYPSRLRQKAVVVPHCFSPAFDDDPKLSAPASAKVIRSIGNFYGIRTPRPLMDALGILAKESPALVDGWTFENVGSLSPAIKSECGAALSGSGLLRFRDPVSYRESLELMASSAGMILIDAASGCSVFLPSKLVEYIGARRPIFGITPEGTARRLIRELGGTTASPADPAAVSKALGEFLQSLPGNGSRGDSAFRDRFSVDRITAEVDALMAKLTNQPQQQGA